jgi:hypothetical protein
VPGEKEACEHGQPDPFTTHHRQASAREQRLLWQDHSLPLRLGGGSCTY